MDSALMDLLFLPYPHLCKNSIVNKARLYVRMSRHHFSGNLTHLPIPLKVIGIFTVGEPILGDRLQLLCPL